MIKDIQHLKGGSVKDSDILEEARNKAKYVYLNFKFKNFDIFILSEVFQKLFTVMMRI